MREDDTTNDIINPKKIERLRKKIRRLRLPGGVMIDSRRNPAEILKAPYARVITPDPETGTFTASVSEFPGCVTQGDTMEEAFENLHAAALDWIMAAQDLGQGIPVPDAEKGYSGRVLVRFPRSVHRRASELAEREGTSLNQFIVSAVSERIGAESVGQAVLERIQDAFADMDAVSASAS